MRFISFFFRKTFQFSQKNLFFIEKSRFKPTEPGLLVYKSTELTSFLLYSGAFIGFITFYSYKHTKEYQYHQGNLYMGSFILVAFVLFQLKLRRTIKNVYLTENGKTSLIELYRFGGFSSKTYRIDHNMFIGFSAFYPKILKSFTLPLIRFQLDKNKSYFFFRTDFIVEDEIFKNAILGKEFKISENSDLNLKLSKKQQKHY